MKITLQVAEEGSNTAGSMSAFAIWRNKLTRQTNKEEKDLFVNWKVSMNFQKNRDDLEIHISGRTILIYLWILLVFSDFLCLSICD